MHKLPRRVNPTCRSGRFRSDSQFDIFHKKPIESDRVFVGIRRSPMKFESDLVGFQSCSVEFRQNPGRIWSKFFRSDGIRSPLSHMGCNNKALDKSWIWAKFIHYNSNHKRNSHCCNKFPARVIYEQRHQYKLKLRRKKYLNTQKIALLSEASHTYIIPFTRLYFYFHFLCSWSMNRTDEALKIVILFFLFFPLNVKRI